MRHINLIRFILTVVISGLLITKVITDVIPELPILVLAFIGIVTLSVLSIVIAYYMQEWLSQIFSFVWDSFLADWYKLTIGDNSSEEEDDEDDVDDDPLDDRPLDDSPLDLSSLEKIVKERQKLNKK